MGYQRGDNRFGGGDDRWREQNRGGGYEGGDRGHSGGERHGNEGGGFFERARSWFSDDDDDRGRDRGGQGHRRDRDYGPAERMTGWGGDQSGGGWGNQRSGGGGWGNERSGGGRGGYRDREGSGGRENEGGQNYGGQGSRDRDYGREQGGGGYSGGSMSGSGGGGADTWGGSGFGGLDDNGRRFDRVDAGSTGTQGAHPMSAPVDGGYGGYGTSAGGFGSSARSAAIMAQARGGGAQQHDYSKVLGDRPQQQRGGGMHDHHYSEWRERQISQLDRDYDEYRREHQSKFEQEFHGWREKRQGQRQSIRKAAPQMEVIGSDGQHIGTVDKVAGDRIILTKNDENAGGHHHSIPCSWIETVDERVTVNKSAEEAMNAWRDEEHNRALFEREDQGSDGPHMLNRSFSGTYDEGQR